MIKSSNTTYFGLWFQRETDALTGRHGAGTVGVQEGERTHLQPEPQSRETDLEVAIAISSQSPSPMM